MTWTISPSVVWSDTGGEVRLYDTTAGEFRTLNPTGSAIWRHLAVSSDRAALVAALAEEFGAQDDNQQQLISHDVDAFIRVLTESGLVVERPAGECPAQAREAG